MHPSFFLYYCRLLADYCEILVIIQIIAYLTWHTLLGLLEIIENIAMMPRLFRELVN